jgi:hypothetical protein
MRFVYVLEDDPKFQKEIFDAIQFIEPKIQVRIFSKLSDFVSWMRLMMTLGPAAINKGGYPLPWVKQEDAVEEAHQLVLVISKIEFLGLKQLSLLRKSRGLFIERGICTKEDPTSIVLTAFDDPNFHLKELGDRILNNIIFKPFDRLILIQHLTFAIDGRHPASKYTIANQKTTAEFEMLKEVQIDAVSEFGLITRSNNPIKPGAVAKYYGEIFISSQHRSVMAICESCVPHPLRPGEFQVALRFFAADPIQISNFRKKVRDPKIPNLNFKWPLAEGKANDPFNVIVIDPEESGSNGLGTTLERKFKGLKTFHYNTFKSFLLDLDPNQMNSKDESPAKPFSSGPEMSFVFDVRGTQVLSLKKPSSAPVKVFNIEEKDFLNKAQWMSTHLVDAHKDKFKRIFKPSGMDSTDDSLFMVRAEGVEYLLNLTGKDPQADGQMILKFTEASKAEWIAYLQKSSKLPAKVDAIFVSYRFLGDAPAERWNWVSEALKGKGGPVPRIFLITTQGYSNAQEREMALYLSDIFFHPIDRGYLALKFHYFFPYLQVLDEPLALKTIPESHSLKVANPVKVVELSEAGYVMEYYRPISVGSFREIVLWQPYELGAPEMLSNCNFTEEQQGKKGVFSCHFVFFGMTDHFLKNIRVWIRDNYISSKEAT